MRMPKLLQPRPTTLTVSEPIVRVSMKWRPFSVASRIQGRVNAGPPSRQ